MNSGVLRIEIKHEVNMAKEAEIIELKSFSELKKELQRVVEVIVDEENEDYSLLATDHAIQTLIGLKNLKFNGSIESTKTNSFQSSNDAIEGLPPEFRCPISGLIIKEPVVLASGQTYDHPFIQKWLKDGNRTCPQTDQLLPHTILTPNHSVKKIIMKWCTLHNIQMPNTFITIDEEYAPNPNPNHLFKLVEKLASSPLSDAKAAAKELRILTNQLSYFQALFEGILNPVSQLLNPVLLKRVYSDSTLQQDFVATILNISIHDPEKKKLLAETPSVVPLLIESLRNENIETRSYAAAAISSLSDVDSNKQIIAKSGAVKPLIDLLEEGHSLILKDVSLTIFNLCSFFENRESFVSGGVVNVIMNKIMDFVLIDEMLEILAMVSSHYRAVEEMEEIGGIFLLLNILEEKSSDRNKEICVAILYAICLNDRRKIGAIMEVNNAHEILSEVARTGNSRAKRKANGILERMDRFGFVSHSA